ncbi:hypothetical protein LOCC1_G003679 [Lachnellula occidentalis]|uniref:Uncharacterized protein n=1 Tax=Lachnellula occidentalis TaxID=215460 RepID=A0A8H8RR64_9HELO|nr:hypothetical protein LOCC1_G003679 [Lachnellula occidentalis]
MGQHVATNIMRQLGSGQVKEENGTHMPLVDCPPIKLMIALSLGETALVYPKDESGLWGQELQETIVGRGLGIDSYVGCSKLCLVMFYTVVESEMTSSIHHFDDITVPVWKQL